MSLASLSTHYEGRNERNSLADLIPQWPELNLALFWFDVKDCRRGIRIRKNEGLRNWRKVRIHGVYWKFTPMDFCSVLRQIEERSLMDDKIVSLSLAFDLYVQNCRPRKWRDRLNRTADVEDELRAELNLLFHPPAQSEEDKKWKRQEAVFKRRGEARKARQARNQADWKAHLPKILEKLRDCEPAEGGKVWTDQSYFFDRIRELGRDQNRLAQENWRDLGVDQSPEVARDLREGLVCIGAHTRRFWNPCRQNNLIVSLGR